MKCSKSLNSIIAILQAMVESGVLDSGQKKCIALEVKNLRNALRSRNHREVMESVNNFSRKIIDAIRK